MRRAPPMKSFSRRTRSCAVSSMAFPIRRNITFDKIVMKKSGLEWKVGLFAFIGLGLLGALLIQFSRGPAFFRPTYEIRLRSSDVGELKIHSSVLLSGVQVGTVTHIKLAPDGKTVTITLRIFKQY